MTWCAGAEERYIRVAFGDQGHCCCMEGVESLASVMNDTRSYSFKKTPLLTLNKRPRSSVALALQSAFTPPSVGRLLTARRSSEARCTT